MSNIRCNFFNLFNNFINDWPFNNLHNFLNSYLLCSNLNHLLYLLRYLHYLLNFSFDWNKFLNDSVDWYWYLNRNSNLSVKLDNFFYLNNFRNNSLDVNLFGNFNFYLNNFWLGPNPGIEMTCSGPKLKILDFLGFIFKILKFLSRNCKKTQSKLVRSILLD